MKNLLTILLATMVAVCTYAQDEIIDLTQNPKQQGSLTLTYPWFNKGAGIYDNHDDFYSLRIKSNGKKMAHIEFVGQFTSNGKTAGLEAKDGNGTLTVKADGISRWNGLTDDLTIWGTEKTTGYYIARMRIWYEGSDFTPTPDGEAIETKPDLGGSPVDIHYYAHAATLPRDGKPVRMAFIYHSKFRNCLQDYMEWKTKQGYDVVELCADEIGSETQTTGDDLAQELRARMMNMEPRPAYILLCGDVDEVPPFHNRTTMAGGSVPNPPTDFFYGEYTGDFYAEAYVGRYSAQTVEQLEAQMEKTQYMAMIKPEEADWLHNSLIVHGPASDISTGNAVTFGLEFPKQFKDNTTAEINVSKHSSINNAINNGCSQVAYIGHGGWNVWYDSDGGYGTSYYNTKVKELTNKNKYPVVMGLTCLSGTFQYYECMAETFMRQKEGGAVAYIGASRESWDGSDNLFFSGGDGGQQVFRHLGYMRSLYHPMPEDESQLSRTIGEAFYIGKFSDRFLGEYQPFRQFMEFFHLFGDPTYQPYITVPEQMFIESEEQSVAAGKTLRVHTAPEAVVSISKGRRVVAVALADKQGDALLYLPANAPVGECVLYSSAPFYNDLESSILITEGNGEEEKRPEKPGLPEVEYADVIDVESAASSLTANDYFPSSQPDAFSVGSDAKYVMWAATNLEPGTNGTQYAHWLHRDDDVRRGLYLRNIYPQCAFITTESAGAVAYVSIDWLNTCGKTEVLGVYGSKNPYTQTTQAWNGQQGTYLGELRKGQNDYLLIEDEWPYILLRAENHENFVKDQSDVFFKSLTIGWNKKEGISTDVTSVATETNTSRTYYDLQGRRMQTPRTGGIYIMNGRKVLR